MFLWGRRRFSTFYPSGFEQRVQLAKGDTISFCVNGDVKKQPVIIFLHPAVRGSSLWQAPLAKIEPYLAAGFSTVHYNRVGFGKSSPLSRFSKDIYEQGAHELIALMDALDVNSAVSMSHCDGSSIAIVAAAIYPERFGAIVLTSPHVSCSKKEQLNIARGLKDYEKYLSNKDFVRVMRDEHGEDVNLL